MTDYSQLKTFGYRPLYGLTGEIEGSRLDCIKNKLLVSGFKPRFFVDSSFLANTGEVLELANFLNNIGKQDEAEKILRYRRGQLKTLYHLAKDYDNSVFVSNLILKEYKNFCSYVLPEKRENLPNFFRHRSNDSIKQNLEGIFALHSRLLEHFKQNPVTPGGKLIDDFYQLNDSLKIRGRDGKLIARADSSLYAAALKFANIEGLPSNNFVSVITNDVGFLSLQPPYKLSPNHNGDHRGLSHYHAPKIIIFSKLTALKTDRSVAFFRRFLIEEFGELGQNHRNPGLIKEYV